MHDARKGRRFEVLARPQLDALYRTASRIVGRRAVAEEIVQEACLRAYAGFDPDDEPAAFRPWLFRIAVNLALDHLRRGQHEATWADGDAAAHSIPDGTLAGGPQAVTEGREIGRALERALAALSTELRAVAVLVLIEELSYADTAEVLGVTVELVRSRLARARTELRRQLAHHGADLAPRSSAALVPPGHPASTAKRGPQ